VDDHQRRREHPWRDDALGADFWPDVLELGTRSSFGAMEIVNPSVLVAVSGSNTRRVNDEK